MLWQPIKRNQDAVIEAGRSYVEDFLYPKRKMSEQVPTWTSIAKWRGRGYGRWGIRDFGLDILNTPYTKGLHWALWMAGVISTRWRDDNLERLPNHNLHDAMKKFVYPEVAGDWGKREKADELVFAITIVWTDNLWHRFCEYFIIRRLIYDRVQRREHFHISSADYY